MPDETTPAQGNPEDGSEQEAPLAAEGAKALEAWKQRAKVAEAEARRAKELEAELAKFRESSMSEQEKAIERARKEAHAEAMKGFNTRLLQAEVRAVAAGKLADPEDAIRFLELDDVTVENDGTVDKKAITKKLDELVKAKPYLAASATRPTGDADQGARGTAGGTDMNDFIRQAAGRGGAR